MVVAFCIWDYVSIPVVWDWGEGEGVISFAGSEMGRGRSARCRFVASRDWRLCWFVFAL